MPFDNSLKNNQTPERVRALCQLVEYAAYTREEVAQLLQPSAINNSQDTTKHILTFVISGKLVIEQDKKLYSVMPPGTTQDPRLFRRTIIQNAHQQPDLVFHRFTAWALGKGQDLMISKADQLELMFFDEVSRKSNTNREYNKFNITAWMDWAGYLGYGFSHNSYFLINPAIRIEEALFFDEALEREKTMPFRQFMQWLNRSVPELDGGTYHEQVYASRQDQRLSYALSAGLRTLHQQGVIRLNTVKDASDVWYLTPSKLHEVSSAVTEITIHGER